MVKESSSSKSSLKTNFIYNTLYQILAICTPIITSPIISRRLGAESIGVYSYTYSIAFFFLLFGMIGIKNYGNRSIAIVRDDRKELSKTFCSIYCFQIITTIILSMAYVGYIVAFSSSNFKIATIQLLVVLSGIFDISWLFFGLEMFKVTTIRNSAVKLLNVALIVVLVKQPSDLWKYTFIMAGGIFLSQIVMWPFLRKLVDFHKVSAREVLSHLKPNIVLFIPVIATNLFKYVDKFMLGGLEQMIQLGFFENGEKLIQIPNSLVTALGTVMLPRMSNLVKHGNREEALVLIHRSMFLSIFMCSAMAFGLMGVAEIFVPFFFGNEFTPTIEIVYVLAPTMLFICWSDVIRTQYLIPQMRDMAYLISFLTACIVNFAVNYMLIPRWGAMGAAIGTLCAEFTVFLIQNILIARELPLFKYFMGTIPFCVFGLIMCTVIQTIHINNTILALLVRVGTGGTIYIILSLIYVYFFQKDLLTGLRN
ncbi:TPA: oligosaccharide flippase family protein [Enterococcus faecium]|uniref:lipopolysaccharide biosynthesis protein n=1 Tax=Enterococcus faecium TaxID=1352 RepID=UPI0002A37610|nr:oligosaccharide flippase family protein [Enterococcus faecium]ELA59265.1 hypothetical protein OGG_03544 [Enterococcus faecium EnGen0013]EOF93744.1 hypothetical protein SKG_01161 [Enterococcus faecium EnGen0166]MDV7710313.1 oligosaccharide flippase family protein [Enterococcus faecium]MDW3723011.1 oligosaccharide flippase family protein [Enterococcus faecium]HAQ7384497.1 oligosaccharide flippase family protein [Enterococcus faecium]